MKAAHAVPAGIGVLALVAIALGLVKQAPAADTKERTPAAAYWMTRARNAEHRAAHAERTARTATTRATAARRALTARSSSLEALRLAATASSSDPAEQQAMYRTLYRLAACESTGTVPAPQPPTPRVLDARAKNPTGEHAAGLLQFLPSTWRTTPYRTESIWSPYSQALAAVWMIKHNRLNEWTCARVIR